MLELGVQHHPGVMSGVTGLFACRAFNLGGILRGLVDDGAGSRMFLLVQERPRLE